MEKQSKKILFEIIISSLLLIFIAFFLYVTANYSYATDAAPVKLDNPLGNKPPQILIGQAINGVLGLVGSIALAMFIYGGFTWMLSQGKPEAVNKGKGILIWSIIGMVVIFAAYAIIQFVFKNVLGMS